MASEGATFVIDPEFAFYGPMGFDIGALLSNLLLSYFSQGGLSNGEEYAEWVLQQAVAVWQTFETTFITLWDESVLAKCGAKKGELYKGHLIAGEEGVAGTGLKPAQQQYMRRLWQDSLGFAGAKMVRRVLGIAHVADLEGIADPDSRAVCEKKCLLLARQMVMASAFSHANNAEDGLGSVSELASAARSVYSSDPSNEWICG